MVQNLSPSSYLISLPIWKYVRYVSTYSDPNLNSPFLKVFYQNWIKVRSKNRIFASIFYSKIVFWRRFLEKDSLDSGHCKILVFAKHDGHSWKRHFTKSSVINFVRKYFPRNKVYNFNELLGHCLSKTGKNYKDALK